MKEENGRLFIRAVGHITAAISATLRQKVLQRLLREPVLEHMFIDLSSCVYMDSTFMGLLVGFNKRFEKLTGRKVELPRPSKACYDLLQNLGVHTFLEITDMPLELPSDMENILKTDPASTEFILKAHENLIEISEENKKRFSLLQKLLKKKLEEEKDTKA